MSLTVCTGWSPEGYELYGRFFAETFARFWPESVKLVVYGEKAVRLPRGEFRLLSEIPGCVEFLERYRDDPIANGRQKLPQHHWKERAVKAGYNWRFDAWKFSRQGFIPLHAFLEADTTHLCWLDGDVVSHANVVEGLIEKYLPAGKVIAYLGRGEKHPDIAFQLYDRQAESYNTTKGFLERFARLYWAAEIFQLKEWHSAFGWKWALDHLGLRQFAHDLTPGGSGHVWFQSPLRAWGDHLKGDRKEYGRSKERR